MMGSIPNLWLAIMALVAGGGAFIMALLSSVLGKSENDDDSKE